MGDLPWSGDMKGCVAIVVFAGSLTQTQCCELVYVLFLGHNPL